MRWRAWWERWNKTRQWSHPQVPQQYTLTETRMDALGSVLLGVVLLLALYRLGGTGEKRFQRRLLVIALVLIVVVIAWMVLR